MPRSCTICTDPRRDEIDSRLLTGDAVSRIAITYAKAESSVRRHRDDHIAQAVALARLDRAHTILAQIEELDAIAKRLQQAGEADGDWRKELAALDRRLRLIEIQM